MRTPDGTPVCPGCWGSDVEHVPSWTTRDGLPEFVCCNPDCLCAAFAPEDPDDQPDPDVVLTVGTVVGADAAGRLTLTDPTLRREP